MTTTRELESGPVADGPDSARVIRVADLVATRWPNGGGWTREIHKQLSAHHPVEPVWRLSLATIDTAGPFSALPEVRRCLLLASDTSLQLSIDGIVHTLGYTDSVEFDGGAAVEVVSVSGACRALNLMTYGGVGGHLEVIRPAGVSSLSRREALAMVVLDGQLRVPDAALGRYDTLLLGPECVRVRCDGATLVRVGLGKTRADLPRWTAGQTAHSTTDQASDTHFPTIEQRGD